VRALLPWRRTTAQDGVGQRPVGLSVQTVNLSHAALPIHYTAFSINVSLTFLGVQMARIKHVIPGLALALSLASAPALAGTIAIDFEHFPGPDGQLGTADDVSSGNAFLIPLRDEYVSLGLRFTQASLLQSGFFDGNQANHFLSSTQPVAQFSVPVVGISIQSNSFWDATLTAYGLDGRAVASTVLANPRSGSAALFGELSLRSNLPIYGFSVTAPTPSQILNLDNLRYTVADVPEPQDAALFGAGLALVGLGLRRRTGRKGPAA
jgi:hypothetical protein